MEGHEGEGWVCEREGEDGKMGPQMGAWLVLVGYVGRPGLQCRGGGDVAARPRSEAATADVCRVGRCFPPPPVRCGAPSAAGQVGPPRPARSRGRHVARLVLESDVVVVVDWSCVPER